MASQDFGGVDVRKKTSDEDVMNSKNISSSEDLNIVPIDLAKIITPGFKYLEEDEISDSDARSDCSSKNVIQSETVSISLKRKAQLEIAPPKEAPETV